MDEATYRMQVLERIERGEISVDEGLQLIVSLPTAEERKPLAALDESTAAEPSSANHPVEASTPTNDQVEVIATPAEAVPEGTMPFPSRPADLPPEARRWRRYWMIPLWIGVALTALGGWLMSLALQSAHPVLWFIGAALPFTLGLLLIVLAGQSRFSPWLHLRVQQKAGLSPNRIAFSFPLPVRPAAWLLRTFGEFIPGVKGTSLDEVLLSIDQVASQENPIYIQVDDGEHGEKVEIFIS